MVTLGKQSEIYQTCEARAAYVELKRAELHSFV